jgi:hypothetical protein
MRGVSLQLPIYIIKKILCSIKINLNIVKNFSEFPQSVVPPNIFVLCVSKFETARVETASNKLSIKLIQRFKAGL